MPGKEVKNWKQYERLIEKGFTKEEAAKITNAAHRKKQEQLRKKK